MEMPHFLFDPNIICAAGIVSATGLLGAYTLKCMYRRYELFLSLGPGGTPPTVPGLMKLELLGLFTIADPLSPRAVSARMQGHPRMLCPESLPTRSGPRPSTAGIAPHRQTSQIPTKSLHEHLVHCIRRVSQRHPSRSSMKLSCFEHNSQGLFSTVPKHRTCSGEVVHAHPSDGSCHLALSPVDANTVLSKGWGQRHPLARGGWFERFVPETFLLIYAPRSIEEIRIVLDIIHAAAVWVAAENFLSSEELDEICYEGHDNDTETKSELLQE